MEFIEKWQIKWYHFITGLKQSLVKTRSFQTTEIHEIISTGLQAVLGQYDLFTDRNTRDHLSWTAKSCVSDTGYLAHIGTARMKQEEEADTRVVAGQ